MSREDDLSAAQRIQQFLEDEAVSGALGRLERRYYEQFLAADSSEKRVTAWAAANVLRDFTHQLQGVVASGEAAAHELLEMAKKEVARKQGRPLPHE